MLTRIYLLTFFLFVHHSALASIDAHQACINISGKLASVTLNECLQRKLSTSGFNSHQQQPLLIKEYPPRLEKRAPQAKILLLGGIHGDEYSSVTIVFKWMQILDRHHSGLFHWKVAPLVNPDGLLRRKSQRMNANGVDLNRNFPSNGSLTDNFDYWRQRAYSDPRRYPGDLPASEAETRWLIKLINEFKPDAIVSVHAPYGVVDFDGPAKPPQQLGPLYLNLLGTYPGSLGNYAALQKGIPVVTVELPYAGIMPPPQQVDRIWTDLVRWLIQHIPQQSLSAQ